MTFVRIDNVPRDYAWGSRTAIAELLGRSASGGPEAELWLGAHPGSPARIVDPAQAGGARDLLAWIDADPAAALGGGDRLPFLLKVLAADSALSLQAHPTPEQARTGFAREEAVGIPRDAPERNYKDDSAKPELIYALSDPFLALSGFRPVAESAAAIGDLAAVGGSEALGAFGDELALSAPGADAATLQRIVGRLLAGGPDVDVLVSALTAAAAVSDAVDADTVRRLAEPYPGDPGIAVALLLHRVTLHPGEALYLAAGNIHAYLEGLGIEIMASSDNVLRGGLTPKHVDVPELLSVLDFRPVPAPYEAPRRPDAGAELFAPPVPDFALARLEAGDDAPWIDAPGPAIALCTEGEVELSDDGGTVRLERGDIVYRPGPGARVTASGAGIVFVGTVGTAAS